MGNTCLTLLHRFLCGSHGGWTVNANVLIQKEALNQLLLGTDVLSDLGFSLIGEPPMGKSTYSYSLTHCHVTTKRMEQYDHSHQAEQRDLELTPALDLLRKQAPEQLRPPALG